MKKLYLFNPDNDLALANNDLNYMAPQSAKQLSRDLALLPVWYAEKGSVVLAESYPNLDYLKTLKGLLEIDCSLITFTELTGASKEFELSPWGWNKALYKQLLTCGLSTSAMIDYDKIDAYRALSHRSQAVQLLQAIPKSSEFCGFSFMLNHIDDLKGIAEHLGPILLKAPISGSGKGLNWCRNGIDKPTLNWCSRILRTQGSIVVEPIYFKVQDFAMEFKIESSNMIEFIGYSSFETNQQGAYLGNRLIPDSIFEDEIDYKYFYHGFMKCFLSLLKPLLLHTLGSTYRGYLGIDMMICKFDSEPFFRLHPCVEINLRMNMGIVAHTIYDRFINPLSRGIFNVDFIKNNSNLVQFDAEQKRRYPLVIRDGRINSGYLALTAFTAQSQYLAWILVE